ncbi:MAG TPA: Ig-like domain-containing protein [Aggregatilinea sp.]|uniref:Ig-like domain-containing protein n=1 Tax=Aggregatilinea sp. TaxID=2806333 RepID=UPI002C4A4DB1|nr:Ig-like domain-containing protein [Aggregatilinea sp.]HML23681.1 Ig-like domain-containing protein [Aggregatilinea sp.]
MTDSQTTSPRAGWLARLDLDRFDRLVWITIAGLILAIGAVTLAGDRVGVYVAENGYEPTGAAGGSLPVRVRFSDDMDAESVAAHFHVSPDVPGDLAWASPSLMIFTPRQPWQAGETYTITLDAGAQSARRGAVLHDPLTWSFTVRLPRAVYIAPSNAFVRNLYMTDLDTGDIFQLTTAEYGIEDFAVSPNGSEIAYSQNNEDGTADLWVLNMLTNAPRQVTNCVDAICRDPAWKPDGTVLAYQREELNTSLGTGVSPARVWLVDLNSLQTGLLFDDSQILGYDPTWDATGQRIGVFDSTLPGIRVHDYERGSDTVIESMQGEVGAFSPNGDLLAYPVLVAGSVGQQFYTHLELADFDAGTTAPISGDSSAPVEDGSAIWSPDGTQLLIARRYLDGRYTPGKQIYMLDPATGEATPLVIDDAYNHAAMRWDAAGTRIVFQRFALQDPDAQPEIWMLDLSTNEIRKLADDAFLPDWVP